MVNENIIPQTETVYELKNEVPSFEEFMKTYQADENLNYDDLSISDINEEKGYGPCKNTLCGCSCSSNTCVCLRADLQAEPDLSGMYASGRAKDGNLSGQAGHYMFGNRKEHGEGRILSSTFGGEIGKDGIKAKLGVDLINVKTEGIQARVGLNVDSGISTSNDTF